MHRTALGREAASTLQASLHTNQRGEAAVDFSSYSTLEQEYL